MRKTRSQTQSQKDANSIAKPAPTSTGRVSSDEDQDIQFLPSSSNLPYLRGFCQSEFDEIEKILATFRVYELQRLVSAITKDFTKNSSRNTKKYLQEIILKYLLTPNFQEVAGKIREFYNWNKEFIALNSGEPSEKRMYQPQMQISQAANIVAAATAAAQQHGMPGNVIPPSGYPILPDVRLKKLAFYDVLAVLLQPATMAPSSQQRLQEAFYNFTLTPQQATDIASNRDIRNGSKIEHTIQVQVRFCLLETSCEQEDCFPSNIILKVNNKLCPLPNPIPTNRPNVEPKRPPRPVNVTGNVKLSPTVTNNISVQWCPDFTRGYVISVYLVRKLTSAQLLHRMKTKGSKPSDYTKGLIKEKLNEDADCEIATTMLKVSLICPLGLMRMNIPCRASTCSHLQCFDASLFLQMNERKPTWTCPVCGKPAVYEALVIDGYFQEVLLKTEDNEIQLHKDGSWSLAVTKSDSDIDTPRKCSQKIEVISDDLEVITEVTERPSSIAKSATVETSAGTSIANNNEPTSTTLAGGDTVDLTMSDSDEDVPLKKRAPKSNTPNSNGHMKTTVQPAITAVKVKVNVPMDMEDWWSRQKPANIPHEVYADCPGTAAQWENELLGLAADATKDCSPEDLIPEPVPCRSKAVLTFDEPDSTQADEYKNEEIFDTTAEIEASSPLPSKSQAKKTEDKSSSDDEVLSSLKARLRSSKSTVQNNRGRLLRKTILISQGEFVDDLDDEDYAPRGKRSRNAARRKPSETVTKEETTNKEKISKIVVKHYLETRRKEFSTEEKYAIYKCYLNMRKMHPQDTKEQLIKTIAELQEVNEELVSDIIIERESEAGILSGSIADKPTKEFLRSRVLEQIKKLKAAKKKVTVDNLHNNFRNDNFSYFSKNSLQCFLQQQNILLPARLK